MRYLIMAVMLLCLGSMAQATTYTWDFAYQGQYWLYGATWSPGVATVPSRGPSVEDEASVFARVNTRAFHLPLGTITGGGYTVTGLTPDEPGRIYGSLYLSPTGGSGSTVLILLSPMTATGGSGNYTYTFDGDTPADYRTRVPPGDWSVYDPARSGTFDEVVAKIEASGNTDWTAFFGPQIGMSGTYNTAFAVTQIQLSGSAIADVVVSPGYDSAATSAAQVRYKAFDNFAAGQQSNDREVYLGTNIAGPPILRSEFDFAYGRYWLATTPFVFSYAPGTGLYTRVDVNIPAELTYTADPAKALGPLNYLQLDVVARTAGCTVTLDNVVVTPTGQPGIALGSFTVTGLWKTWNVKGIDLSAGFTVTGDLLLSTSTPMGNSENDKAQISVGKSAVLFLDVTPDSVYVQPGQDVIVDLKQANLPKPVVGFQAFASFETDMLDYVSTTYTDSPYDMPIFNDGASPPYLPVNVGADLNIASGSLVANDIDANLATIKFTARDKEGTTQVAFRASDAPTQFADNLGNPVAATTLNSVNIYIDGTAPTLTTSPADGTSTPVTAATQTITGTASDDLSGIASLTYTLNAGAAVPVTVTAGAFSVDVVLVPEANTVVFTLTDNAGNVATSTIGYTYTQPAPTIDVYRSIAPNGFAGGSSWNAWLANAIVGARDQTSPVGTPPYAQFKDFDGTAQDYAAAIVTRFNSWMGLITGASEWGNRTTYVYRLCNGVIANPGAAKLNLDYVSVTWNTLLKGADSTPTDDYWYDFSYSWLGKAGSFAAGTQRLKGYNWSGSAWVEVTSGREADLIIYNNGDGFEPDGYPTTPNQAYLNELYKQLSGSLLSTGETVRRTLDHTEYQVGYAGHAGVTGATSGLKGIVFTSVDRERPVVTITTADVSPSNNNVFNVVGTVADNETLASGVRSVEVKLNDVRVYYDSTATATSFSVAVSLSDGSTGNVITVIGKDFAGNERTDTINVPDVRITVILQGVTASPTRWIKFVIGGSGGPVAPVTVTKQVAFTGGTGSTTLFLPKAGTWTKVSAKDEQHTVRKTVDITGGSASLILMGGDATNDNWVDILDFGVLAGQWGTTGHPWVGRDADFNCSTTVGGADGSADFTFIQIHFLAKGDAEPGAAQTAGLEMPMTSISVKELAKIVGMRAARKADVNNDGVVDTTDMKLFMDKHPRVKR